MADDAAQIQMEMQTAQRRLQQLDQNLARLEQTMQEITTAIATLEGLSGDSTLSTQVPIGAGIRVAANIDPSNPVLMDLGSGYSTSATAAQAVEKLRDRQRNTEAAFRATSDEADKTAQRFQDLQARAMAPSAESS